VTWELVELGATGLRVSPLILGGGPLGSMPENFGYEVAERDAIELVHAFIESDIRTIDTANGYSHGLSEQRIGRAISEYGRLPDDFLVITKVDPDGDDYSGGRIRRSLDESADRLGMSFLPLVHLHDPEFHDFGEMTSARGPIEALVAAREAGQIGHLGLAGGDVREVAHYLDLGVFDVLLVHNRWTLVDRSAGALMARAAELGVPVLNAAVFGGGILADETGTSTQYGYRPASAATLDAIRAMREVSRAWGITLADAALRASTRDPQIAATIVGMSKVARVQPAIAAATRELPEEFWHELDALVPEPAHWLDADSPAAASSTHPES
jgi:D-threo-aldose 1-dehydrogenase